MNTAGSPDVRNVRQLGLVVLFAFSLVCAVLIGAGELLPVAGLVMLAGTLSLLYWGARGIEDRRGWLLAAGWCVMLFAHGARQVSGMPVGYVLEFLEVGVVLATARCVRNIAEHDRALRVLLILLLLHFAFALLSSLLGRSHAVAALWQLQYNLKWPLMFGLGTLLIWNDRVEGVMRKVVGWSWIFIGLALALEIGLYGVHSQIFGLNLDRQPNPFLWAGGRYRGPFSHAGYFAIICALLTVGAIVQLLAGRGRAWGLVALIYFAFVLASGQRQELLALALALGLLGAIRWRDHLPLLLIGIGCLVTLAIAGFIYVGYLPMQSTLAQWGLVADLSPLSERAIISTNGIAVAQQYFPLGSGLGTYGGAGAQKFDLSLFVDLGFGRYWWFQEGLYILDTYWPCIVAESGFFGAFLVFLFFLVMWSTLFRRAWYAFETPVFGLNLLALGSLTLLLGNTPSSPILTDPRGALVFWLIIGAAWRASVPVRAEPKIGKAAGAPVKGIGPSPRIGVFGGR